jgi:hypothetical protein
MLPPQNEPFQKHWLMFLLRPVDLLKLLEIISNPTNLFAAGALPPDVRIEDVFYDESENYLGLMLESEIFRAGRSANERPHDAGFVAARSFRARSRLR